jgi:hypothetical protein
MDFWQNDSEVHIKQNPQEQQEHLKKDNGSKGKEHIEKYYKSIAIKAVWYKNIKKKT